MMRVLVAEERRFFQELVPVRAAHVWRDRFCWPQATMKSDDYDNENELAFMGAAQ
jgi:hypothetical protein